MIATPDATTPVTATPVLTTPDATTPVTATPVVTTPHATTPVTATPVVTTPHATTTVAAAGLALRQAEAGTFAIPERPGGPRFPNGYVAVESPPEDRLRRAVERLGAPLRLPITAGRWWDSQVRVGILLPDRVERFVAWTDPVDLPGAPEACIGWGPGLTPAADDVVVGMLVAFHAAGHPERARQLAAVCSGCETVALSRSLIDHAAQGRAARPVLDLMGALAGRTSLAGAIAALDRFGATSGRHLIDGARRALVEVGPRLGPPHEQGHHMSRATT